MTISEPWTWSRISSPGRDGPLSPRSRSLLTVYDARVTEHVKEVMGRIDAVAASEELGCRCKAFAEHDDVEDFHGCLARALIPGTKSKNGGRSSTSGPARPLDYRAPDDTAEDRVRLLAHLLGGKLGFRGNSEDYYNPDNTLLPRVMETRLGIPITLTLLYMLVGHRCGARVEGINFPGHFLARHDGILFDPFERGRIIGIPECRANPGAPETRSAAEPS